MRFFKRGFWQKLLIYLSILVEIGLLVYFVFAWFSSSINEANVVYFLIAFWVISFICGVIIIANKSEETYKIAWLFLVGLIPIIGPLFYLLFAHKFNNKRQREEFSRYYKILSSAKQDERINQEAKDKYLNSYRTALYLERTAEARLYANSDIAYYPYGEYMYKDMLEELNRAKHYIFMEYFIITPGKMWDSILEILERKVKQGVDVRVIYDDIGNLGSTPVDYDKTLKEKGIKCCIYRKVKPFVDARYSNRDHRKIMVIDGHTAFTGGINLADEYINAKDRFGIWKDNAIRVKGKAVSGYTLLFLATWHTYFEKTPINYDFYRSDTFIDEIGGYPPTDGYILPYGDLPYSKYQLGESTYIDLISRARDYIYMTTPYLLPTNKLYDSMRRCALSGVDVRLMMPGIPDKKLVYQVSRSYYGDLLRAGVKIYEFTEGFVHEKTFIQDDEAATVGTVNLDFRSLCLHSENGTLIIGNRHIKDMKDDFLLSLNRCHEVTYNEWRKWKKTHALLWLVLRLFAPLL